MNMITISLTVLVVLPLQLHAQRDTLSWNSNKDRVTRWNVGAKFVRLNGENVFLEKDGKQFIVPFAKLSGEVQIETTNDQDASTVIHNWTSSDGRPMRAKFVKLVGESVVLDKDDKKVTVSFEKLSAESVAWAKKLSVPPVPKGLVLIPAGEFTMGDSLDGDSNAPSHTVSLSAYYIQTKEVSWELWALVICSSRSRGYTDFTSGNCKAIDHPVQAVSWYQAVKWCNALSEQDGLTPCYYTNAAQTEVYRTGSKGLDNSMVKWSANGYRLPTEAEWEKAARGGLTGKRFPWGDTISVAEANFLNGVGESYRTGSTDHSIYHRGDEPYTSPVGSFPPNDYGLYDITGNAMEWAWDWHGSYPSTTQTNPHGADSGTHRVSRGGSWTSDASSVRCYRRLMCSPDAGNKDLGFRLVRSRL